MTDLPYLFNVEETDQFHTSKDKIDTLLQDIILHTREINDSMMSFNTFEFER